MVAIIKSAKSASMSVIRFNNSAEYERFSRQQCETGPHSIVRPCWNIAIRIRRLSIPAASSHQFPQSLNSRNMGAYHG